MKLKEKYVRWVGIVILAFIMAIVFGPEEGETFLHKYLKSLMFTTIYWNGAFFLFITFRKKYPEIRQTPKRLLITLFWLALFLIVGDNVICLLISKVSLSELNDISVILRHAPQNLIAAFAVGSIYENVYFFEQWHKTIKVNEELKNQQIRTQFEVLQNQMSPHFLFNSLNTLTTLIAEDQDIAIEFTEKLSEVYRYILQNKEKELVELEEELIFVKAYVFLLKMRYPENLNVEFNVGEEHSKQHIAPLTIQMLVENAIKHNIVSKAKPLYIEIYVENGKSIIVKNNLQQKKVIEKSTKTGLANIRKRYQYFGKEGIDVITTANNFMVAVPLLKVIREKQAPQVAAI